MQIDAIELFHVSLPLRQPQNTPAGDLKTLETVLVRMESGGLSGWGEASPGNSPLTASEWTSGAFLCLRDWLAPRLAGSSVDSGRDLQERLEIFRGNRFAKSGLDLAWWDLEARRQGKPLPELLGKARDAVEIGTSFDRMESIDALLDAMRQAVEAGYSRIELKFRPGWDIPVINAVRYTFPTLKVHIDIEGTMRLDHQEMLCRLDDFNLAMVEQPLPADDLVGHAMIQEAVRTPLCLDESITSKESAEMALELHSARYINVKPGRVGGLTPAIAIHDACHEECTPCWVSATPQSAIGTRHSLALATKANFTYPADFYPPQTLEADLAAAPEAVKSPEDGVLRVPLWTEPGIGVDPNSELLEKFTIARARIA